MFKKTLLLVFFIFTTTLLLNAQQLEKGTAIVGLSGAYINVSGSGIGIVNGSYLGMLNSNIALGGFLNFLSGGNTSVVTLGPSLRGYLTNTGTSRPFLLGNLGINTSSGGVTYNGGIGLSNFLNEHIAVDIAATYGNSITLGGINSSSSSGVFAIQLGFQVFLPKKK